MFAVANYLSISEGWTGGQEEAGEGWRKRSQEGEEGESNNSLIAALHE